MLPTDYDPPLVWGEDEWPRMSADALMLFFEGFRGSMDTLHHDDASKFLNHLKERLSHREQEHQIESLRISPRTFEY